MKIVLWVVGAVVLLAGGVVLVGYLLPEAHVATAGAEYEATAQEVWEAITDVSAFPEWRPDVERVEVASVGGAPVSWTEFGASGAIPFVVDQARPPRELVTRIDSESLPFGGTWTYRVESADGDRTRLTITEDGRVYNPIFRFVSRFVMGHSATMEAYLRALDARLGAAD